MGANGLGPESWQWRWPWAFHTSFLRGHPPFISWREYLLWTLLLGYSATLIMMAFRKSWSPIWMPAINDKWILLHPFAYHCLPAQHIHVLSSVILQESFPDSSLRGKYLFPFTTPNLSWASNSWGLDKLRNSLVVWESLMMHYRSDGLCNRNIKHRSGCWKSEVKVLEGVFLCGQCLWFVVAYFLPVSLHNLPLCTDCQGHQSDYMANYPHRLTLT